MNSSLTKECQNGDSTQPDSTPKSLPNTAGFQTNHHDILSSQPQSGFLPIQRVITGIVPRTFRRYQVPRFSQAINNAPALIESVSRAPALPGHSLSSLLLALSQSLISSTIRTSRPTLPRLSVGGGRTVPVTVYPCGSPLHGLPSIHNRIVTVRCPSPARPTRGHSDTREVLVDILSCKASEFRFGVLVSAFCKFSARKLSQITSLRSI